MSFRLLSYRVIKHGRNLLYNYTVKRNIHINILEDKNKLTLARNSNKVRKCERDSDKVDILFNLFIFH